MIKELKILLQVILNSVNSALKTTSSHLYILGDPRLPSCKMSSVFKLSYDVVILGSVFF